MTFSELNLAPGIAKAIQACGYTIPTPVQARSIPEILNGKDMVASAQTGSGKTAAFVLPALHRLSEPAPFRKPRVLILTPTRELASQIKDAAAKYGKFIKFFMANLVGGMSYRQQLRDLSRPVDLIVATPGRLLDHMENRRLDLSGIEMLVLDEADRMLDMGFIDDVQTIAKATPNTRQTLLFSATVDNKLDRVIKTILKNPVRINLSPEKLAPSQIKQSVYLADNPQHRSRLLQHLLDNENIFKAIIFSATKIGADKLASELSNQGYAAAALHGDLKQSQRNRTVENLRRGKIQFLVATDVAARGIDIADMTHVINYDMPRFCEDYVHRIGRTGRAGKSGIAISFAMPSDARHIQRIERYVGHRLELATIVGLEPKQKGRQAGSSSHNEKSHNKPKKKWGFKDNNESRGGRSDRPKKSWGAKDDRDGRPGKPKKKWESKDNNEFRGGRSEKPKKSWGSKENHEGRSEKPKKKWESRDNNEFRGGRSEKPKKSWGSKENHEGRSEKPKKKWESRDNEFRGGRSDKPKKNWTSEAPKKKWASKDNQNRDAKSGSPAKKRFFKANKKSTHR